MKKFFPFMMEGLICIFVVTVFLCASLLSVMGIISLNTNIWFVTALGLVGVVLYSSETVKIALKATVDALFKQSIVQKGTITDIVHCQRSVFSERRGNDHVIKRGDLFYINFVVGRTQITLISACPINAEKNKNISICFGRFSRIIFEIEED